MNGRPVRIWIGAVPLLGLALALLATAVSSAAGTPAASVAPRGSAGVRDFAICGSTDRRHTHHPIQTGSRGVEANDRVYLLGYREDSGTPIPVMQIFNEAGQFITELEFRTAEVDEAGHLLGFTQDGSTGQVRDGSGQVLATLPGDAEIGASVWRPWSTAVGTTSR